eukprot:CAMPEP_0117745512 /NCGR_PEP_ID=MMETSP0947-20121206/7400_1 /TAXON_ID=44440 /ORGANISM="Chattonella subsalsa, Strain CCMP2191" /LENGTH=167 /DNA_ID=CAMNT_0005562669 /DNA_START=1 /DNA_END=501 /DNA_ORIENTATION=+
MAAVDKSIRWIPKNSPQILKFHMDIGELAVDEQGRTILMNQPKNQSLDSNNGTRAASNSETDVNDGKDKDPSPTTSKRKKKGRKKEYLDVDKAILLLLPVWDAEEEWKQTMLTISAILMIQRWVRRVRGKVQERRRSISKSLSSGSISSSRTVEKLREAKQLDNSIT